MWTAACEHFGGKSKEEAMQLFQKDAAHCQEDPPYTPNACFPY